jgi:hypothetical protein
LIFEDNLRFRLKSKACQFELYEGRKKQKATWENIFSPIHIDDFLFLVKKNQIRPIHKADEFWENIEELRRRINSKDFSEYNIPNPAFSRLAEEIENIVQEFKL